MKRNYIDFEIEYGQFSFSHIRLLGHYYLEEDGKSKLKKDYILSVSPQNKDLIEWMLRNLRLQIATLEAKEIHEGKRKSISNK